MKKNKTIWIIAIIFGILTISLLATFIIIKFNYTTEQDNITWSDWLTAACSLLSAVGTVSLSCVALKQSETANVINERLLQQNIELQKINDYQFKIANQSLLPLLQPNDIFLQYNGAINTETTFLKNWEKCCLTNYENRIIKIDVDCRYNKNMRAKYCHLFKFTMKNKSKSVIKNITIYKLALNSPFNNVVEVDYQSKFILSENESVNYVLDLCYEDDKRINTNNFGMAIFIEITLISDIKFYEKVHVFADSDYLTQIGTVEKLDENKILN